MRIKQEQKIEACPISFQQIDRNLVKLYSGFVLSILTLSLFFSFHIGIYLISIDFAIRVFIGIKYSPLCIFLTKGLKITAIKPKLIDSGRKKIAAKVGFLLSTLISLLTLYNLSITATILTVIFIFAILIDLLFDYCLACKMQSIYLKLFSTRK